eukprot:3896477-Pyramimonas_sp.AAC.1
MPRAPPASSIQGARSPFTHRRNTSDVRLVALGTIERVEARAAKAERFDCASLRAARKSKRTLRGPPSALGKSRRAPKTAPGKTQGNHRTARKGTEARVVRNRRFGNASILDLGQPPPAHRASILDLGILGTHAKRFAGA